MNRYEDLRAAALGDPGTRHAVGLFLFQRDGMMTWLRAITAPSVKEAVPLAPLQEGCLLVAPPTVHEEVVHVLACLVVREPQGGMGIESRAHHS